MSIDPRTPVLVAAASLNQRVDDPREASEPLELMAQVMERAARDAGSTQLLSQMDEIWAPRGFWEYSNPGKILADRFGAAGARTAIAEIGILQTTLLGGVADRIAEGKAEIAILVGAEAKDRAARARRQGLEVPLTKQTDSEPDLVIRPGAEIMGTVEIELGLITPTIQYAMIDNAIRASEGQSLDAHREELGRLWGDFNRVAVENPHAWNRTPLTPEEITTPTEENRLLAFPYTKSLVSQWNVNQSAALILCAHGKARALGLDESRFVYPLSVVDSEHMVTLSKRREIHRSPGFRFAGERAFEHVGHTPADIDLWELYSCFPAAVRAQQREIGIDPAVRVTGTGGMTFGGGPLNNFVLQGWARMAETMREAPGQLGVVTAVSGLLTKQGVSIFGPEPSVSFAHEKVTKEVSEAQTEVEVLSHATGSARVATYTVARERGAAQGVVLVFDLDEPSPQGVPRRTLRVLDDPDLAELGLREELCGRAAELSSDGSLRWR